MWVLTATTHKLQIKLGGSVTATQPSVHVYWVQYDSSTPWQTPGSNNTATNNTTAVDIVAVPTTSTAIRDIKRIVVLNRDSASVTVTLGVAISGTLTATATFSLASGAMWMYDWNHGVQTFNSAANLLTANTIETTTLLNSTYHSDTLTSSVARGSLIYGNSTPKWAALTVGAANRILCADGTDVAWAQADHGAALTGLSDDDHTQYALLAGRSSGQTLVGGTGSAENLTLNSTSDSTKGLVKLATGGGNVTIGGSTAASELRFLEPSGSGSNYTAFKAQAQSGDVTYTLPAADGTSGYVLSTNGSGTLSWAASSSFDPSALTEQTIDVLDYIAGYDTSGAASAKFLVAKSLKADNRHSITVANGTDASHDLDFTWGYLLDSTGAYQFKPGSITKQSDAAWAEGTNAGGGSVSSSTSYDAFLIAKTDGTQDVQFLASTTSPTIQSGYTYWTRLHSFFTASDGTIKPGLYKRGWWEFTTPSLDVNNASVPTSGQLDSLVIPSARKFLTKLAITFQASTTFRGINFRDPDTTDQDPDEGAGSFWDLWADGGTGARNAEMQIWSDTSRRIRTRGESGNSDHYWVKTKGYWDAGAV